MLMRKLDKILKLIKSAKVCWKVLNKKFMIYNKYIEESKAGY